ncbi:glycoside hydrolase [Penicillium sp. IBT 16267x]|nr:glycoside hydrolase [Penicillium sp. IBT 16267x]
MKIPQALLAPAIILPYTASPQFEEPVSIVQGFDVSHYQTAVDFQAAYTDGARFVIIKATEGITFTDSRYNQHTTGAINVGLIHGAYHFARPAASTGGDQANFFITNGGGWTADGMTLPGMLDLENNPSGPQCYGHSQSDMIDWITDFVDVYSGITGRFPMIYTTNNWWRTCTGDYNGFSRHCPLVLARYAASPGTIPGGWTSHTIWQNLDSYPYGGDSDIFNGNEADLLSLACPSC